MKEYGNGARVEYEYDEAERLTVIRHKVGPGGDLVLELAYAYNPRGLITQINESDGVNPVVTTTFEYDQRGRLIEEHRQGDHAYWLTYEYDQGGNRLWKKQFDPEGDPIAQTRYRYDTDAEPADYLDNCTTGSSADCTRTKHNRLMYYKTEVWFEEGQTAEFRLAERVWYQYLADSAAVGSPDYIVRRIYNPANPGQPPTNYGYGLIYNTQGTLWYITLVQWTGATCPQQEEHEVISRHEFRSVGRAMRLTRVWDPDNFDLPKAGTNVWHDYDGDEIYADVAIEFDEWGVMTTTELAAHEPGIGSYDYAATAASYRHGDQIGSTRAIAGEPDGGAAPVTGRIVYTAFGERVWSDGTVGTRYQYAGAWGYQSDLYEDASGNLPFVHVGHRWYDPSTGRFLQRDPIGIEGGVDVYGYAGADPLGNIDPFGLAWWNPFDYDPVARATLWATGGCGYVPVMDPGTPQQIVQTSAEIIALAAPCGAALKGTKWLSNARGLEWTLNKNFRVGWHSFKLHGKDVSRPHYHRRPGIGRHRPWEGW